MFEGMTYDQKTLIYRGLKALIESKSGFGFHNADMGHPVYLTGESESATKEMEYADSPAKSTLFQMLSELSKDFLNSHGEAPGFKWWYDFSTWQQFCHFAVSVHKGQQP